MNESHQEINRAVFLDRDGTINVEKGYLHRIEDFEFIPGVPEALKRLQDAGFLLIVVSNQSGIARGYFSIEMVHRLHEYMCAQLKKRYRVDIDGVYFCPHHPTKGLLPYNLVCDCRKEKPGMLLQAARDHGINLAQSYMIGDKLSDVQAGRAAGCHSFLIRTEMVELCPTMQCESHFAGLPEAVNCILGGK